MFAAPEGTELVEHLGGGTTFDVGLVRDGHAVLVCKRLTPRMREEPRARAALVREARILALAGGALSSGRAVVPALARVGADGHGPYVLEARVLGRSLRDVGDAWRARAPAGVPSRLVAHVVLSAVEALAALHELADAAGPLDAVHGDLAPDHVVLGPIGEIAFVDFGAARCRGDGGDGAPDADARGTLPFVAPELARGEACASAATDVFALAATLVSFATGLSLTRATGDAAQLLEVGERGLRPEACDALAELAAPLRRALAFHPGDRFASARALSRALSTG